MVDYNRLRSCGNLGSDPDRIWQEFGRLSRRWQKQQIAVNCGKLRSYAQSFLTKLVEIGSGVL
jgi:hypothetical protein